MEMPMSGDRAGLGWLYLYMLSLDFENLSEEAKIPECLEFEAYMNANDQANEQYRWETYGRNYWQKKRKRLGCRDCGEMSNCSLKCYIFSTWNLD